jgi:putative ABC transport system permease protein
MLMAEALLVTGAGALAGLVAGLGFGWLGTRAIVRQAWVDGQVQFDPRFAVDWPLTGGLLATLTVAAVLASLLPARRAAKATVVEALADV